ncbi:MAG: cupin domain-containing protein [Nocardioidaceae bacterium]|nr:cupin domain-containing protein [Nocardioidaceae bacterium]
MSDPERVVCADALTADLGETDTDALASVALDLGSHGGVTFGLWEAGPGTDTDVETDEHFLVLSGAGTVSFEDGSTVELKPGVLVRLREGEHTRWEITERLRKLYLS